jgi:ribosomal protein S6--L-glutamate ligase
MIECKQPAAGMRRKAIALEGRLRNCRNVITLGVKTNFTDYGEEDARLIRDAYRIYYPTAFYADLFDALGKKTFPSYHTYKCVQDKIKQTALFELLAIPHPSTRVFYGKRQKAAITRYFRYPFVGKIPRGSAMGRGVYLIHNDDDLHRYLQGAHPAYIQQYLPHDRDMRVVIIGDRVVHAYWRVNPPDDFRSNVAVGGRICLETVPEKALELALHTARSCGWNDVGIDVCEHEGRFVVLEANMKYGKEGFQAAGIDYIAMMEKMIEDGKI